MRCCHSSGSAKQRKPAEARPLSPQPPRPANYLYPRLPTPALGRRPARLPRKWQPVGSSAGYLSAPPWAVKKPPSGNWSAAVAQDPSRQRQYFGPVAMALGTTAPARTRAPESQRRWKYPCRFANEVGLVPSYVITGFNFGAKHFPPGGLRAALGLRAMVSSRTENPGARRLRGHEQRRQRNPRKHRTGSNSSYWRWL
jgi:hypothetical protein